MVESFLYAIAVISEGHAEDCGEACDAVWSQLSGSPQKQGKPQKHALRSREETVIS